MTSQMDFDVAEFERDAAAHLVRCYAWVTIVILYLGCASLFSAVLFVQGNANGNIFVRKQGVPKQNDGQGKSPTLWLLVHDYSPALFFLSICRRFASSHFVHSDGPPQKEALCCS